MGNGEAATQIDQQAAFNFARMSLDPSLATNLASLAPSLAPTLAQTTIEGTSQSVRVNLAPTLAQPTVALQEYFPPTIAAIAGIPHQGVGNYYEQHGSAVPSSATVQQHLPNLQASFQQQIAALGAALGASTTLDQSAESSGVQSGLPMYPENSVTIYPILTTAPHMSGQMGNSTGLIVGEKLNGQNYFSWSQSVKMVLEGRHKFGYLTGEIPKPRPGNPQERFWKGEDSLLRSLLIHSMEPQIGKPLLYAATA